MTSRLRSIMLCGAPSSIHALAAITSPGPAMLITGSVSLTALSRISRWNTFTKFLSRGHRTNPTFFVSTSRTTSAMRTNCPAPCSLTKRWTPSTPTASKRCNGSQSADVINSSGYSMNRRSAGADDNVRAGAITTDDATRSTWMLTGLPRSVLALAPGTDNRTLAVDARSSSCPIRLDSAFRQTVSVSFAGGGCARTLDRIDSILARTGPCWWSTVKFSLPNRNANENGRRVGSGDVENVHRKQLAIRAAARTRVTSIDDVVDARRMWSTCGALIASLAMDGRRSA